MLQNDVKKQIIQLNKELDWFAKQMIDCPPIDDCPKGYAMPCKWKERRECWRELARKETGVNNE